MADSDAQRKLTAILCADVVGYSRLIGDDRQITAKEGEGTIFGFMPSRCTPGKGGCQPPIRPFWAMVALSFALALAGCGGGDGGGGGGGPGNSAPVADDLSLTTLEDIPASVTLTASDANGDALTFTVVSSPANGSLSGTAPDLAYVPARNFNGSDSFTYQASDGTANSNTATVALVVDPVNDPPTADDQSLSTPEDTVLAITLTGSDLEGSGLTFSVAGGPFNGTLSGTTAARTYTPDAGFRGVDLFTFTANDGTDVSNAASVFISVFDAAGPADVTGFSAKGEDGQMLLAWSDPADADLAGVLIRRREDGTFPTGTTDGVLVLEAARGLQSTVDGGLVNGTTYHYAAFAFDDAGNFAAGVTTSDTAHLPLTLEDQKAMASDAQAGDFFGFSVAIDGDYAIVGAPLWDALATLDTGAAYIFHRDPITGSWDSGVKITAPDAQAGDWFGYSAAISGDYAVVGAIFEDGASTDPNFDSGAAYVFRRTGLNTWDTGTKIVASDPQANDQFGSTVAISGDYAIVGAAGEDGGTGDPVTNAGAAYLFRRTGLNTWEEGTAGKIVASDPRASDVFGHSVAISGDYAIVGAHSEDGGTGDPVTNAGAAYVFRRTGLNTWEEGTAGKIVAFDPQASDFFGTSVAISGDYAIVGAVREDGVSIDPNFDSGAAYVFRRIGPNDWSVGAKIVASDAQASDFFGNSVAINGDYAMAGAQGEDGGAGDPLTNAGAAYVFRRISPNDWSVGAKIVASDAQASDFFGFRVAFSGDTAIVGSPFEDGASTDPNFNSGAAYFFR